MKKKTWWRSGFTIIEVTLVLAITGLLVVSVMGFLSGNINNRRYIDSYNELSATLKSVYSSVVNVKNPRGPMREAVFIARLILCGMKMVG